MLRYIMALQENFNKCIGPFYPTMQLTWITVYRGMANYTLE